MQYCIRQCSIRTRSPSAPSRSTRRSPTGSARSASSSATWRTARTCSSTRRDATASRRSSSARPAGYSQEDPRRVLRPHADADEGAFRRRAREDDLQRPRVDGRPGARAGREPLPRPPHHADDGGRPERRQPALRLSRRPAAGGHRRHDRGPARAPGPDRGRAQAPRRARLRRVPGDRLARPPVSRTSCARSSRSSPRSRTSTSGASSTCSSGSSTTATSPSGGARSASSSARSRRRSSRRFLRERFDETEKGIDDEAVGRLLSATGGHPYGTQELAYFVWELVPRGHFARLADVEAALEQALRSEHNHFAKIWDDAPYAQRLLMLALAEEPTRSLYAADYAAAARPAAEARAPARHRRPRSRRRSSAATDGRRLPDHRAVLRRLAPEGAGPPPRGARYYQPSPGSA